MDHENTISPARLLRTAALPLFDLAAFITLFNVATVAVWDLLNLKGDPLHGRNYILALSCVVLTIGARNAGLYNETMSLRLKAHHLTKVLFPIYLIMAFTIFVIGICFSETNIMMAYQAVVPVSLTGYAFSTTWFRNFAAAELQRRGDMATSLVTKGTG